MSSLCLVANVFSWCSLLIVCMALSLRPPTPPTMLTYSLTSIIILARCPVCMSHLRSGCTLATVRATAHVSLPPDTPPTLCHNRKRSGQAEIFLYSSVRGSDASRGEELFTAKLSCRGSPRLTIMHRRHRVAPLPVICANKLSAAHSPSLLPSFLTSTTSSSRKCCASCSPLLRCSLCLARALGSQGSQ